LGSEKCEKAAFNEFLTSLKNDKELTDLVLLGDIVDMWRRDASGVFLENMGTMFLLKELQDNIKVHWLAGNHDYHLLKLKNRAPHYDYPFEFHETIELTEGDHTYRFVHGYEFEYGNELKYLKPVLELLCHVMSDAEGVPEDETWANITKIMGDLHYSALSQVLQGQDLVVKHKSLHDSPGDRLAGQLEKVEKRAYDSIGGKSGHTVIFGHTHHPFISKGEELINTGSWVTDATPHNTYLVIEEGKPRLFIFGGEEITDRKEISLEENGN